MIEVKRCTLKVLENIEQVIFGKQHEIIQILIALLCEGHVLVEDVPGVGKTTLSRAVARSLGCTFARIQCTPDLLPTDLTGVDIFNPKTGEFEFRAGPLHKQIVLADEINRATPKTQSALLECMEERQVTVGNSTYELPRPFLVLATQNPVEYEGTYPLPEAQLDRFFLRVRLGYPSVEAERKLLRRPASMQVEALKQVISIDELREMQQQVRKVHVEESLEGYILELVRTTRKHKDVLLGASPRGSLCLYRASQARAAIEGRDYVLPDDIKAMAVPVLAHRLILTGGAEGGAQERVVEGLLRELEVPLG